MAKRQGIGKRLRFEVLSRDGFTCRYCGAQAGKENVRLAIDHVISVVDGGDNSLNNLVTSCYSCNSGKSSMSLDHAPSSEAANAILLERAESIERQVYALRLHRAVSEELNQEIVNLKCRSYEVKEVQIKNGERVWAKKIIGKYGVDCLAWLYERCAQNGVPEFAAIKYACGILKNAEAERELGIVPGWERENATP